MGEGIRINRMAERFSSHTLSQSRSSVPETSRDTAGLRERLIAALVETVAEGGDPRLVQSRARP
jgi:cobalamin biosynthesis protein CobD/CbiB